jgi:hypothetical protein
MRPMTIDDLRAHLPTAMALRSDSRIAPMIPPQEVSRRRSYASGWCDTATGPGGCDLRHSFTDPRGAMLGAPAAVAEGGLDEEDVLGRVAIFGPGNRQARRQPARSARRPSAADK